MTAFQKPAELESRRLRLSLIDIPPEYEGKESLVEDDALRRSIEKSGVQQSVIVIPDESITSTITSKSTSGRYTVVKGARRVRISLIVGLHEIPAVVVHPPSGADLKKFRNELRMILTQARQDLLPSQRAHLIVQLKERFGLNNKDVAAYLGVDAGSITHWLSVLSKMPGIMRAVDSGEITLHVSRAFDGMSQHGQQSVWKARRREIATLSGRDAQRLVRAQYGPATHPEFYVAPEKSERKIQRTEVGRQRPGKRPQLSAEEKKRLSRDLSLREVELKDSQKELDALKREIKLATPVIHAIMRNDSLVTMLPDEIGEEFTRFVEIY